MMKPILGITMGDAAGIGPEITLKSFRNHPELFDLCRPLVIGSAAVDAVLGRATRDANPHASRHLPAGCGL